MSDLLVNLQHSRKNLLLHLLLPVAALLVMSLSLMVATVFWTSKSIDSTEDGQQNLRVKSALNSEKKARADRLSFLTISDEAWNSLEKPDFEDQLITVIAKRSFNYFDFESAYIFDQNNRLIVSSAHGEKLQLMEGAVPKKAYQFGVDRVKKNIQNFIDRTDKVEKYDISNLASSSIVYNNKQPYFVVASPIAPEGLQSPDKWLIAVAFKRIDKLTLHNFSAKNNISNPKIVETLPDQPELYVTLSEPDQKNTAYFVWDQKRLGQEMRSKLVPLVLLVLMGTLGFTYIIFNRVRKIELELKSSEENARQLIGHDALSGLANRLLFSMRLDQELSRLGQSTSGIAVFFLDLDRFKEVNDTHGHQAGDELIKQVAQRLSALLHSTDTLSRFGGDEFAIIQTNVKRAIDAEKLGRQILETITEPFEIAGTLVSVGVSMGIALAPENGFEREKLMQLADTALYQSKNDGRNRYSFFESQMNETLRMRKLVEDELRHAIDNDGLLLHYQPQMSPDGKTMRGVEALVRWPHPIKGMISPVQFIPVAEERGLIVPLGEWVLRQACLDGLLWPDIRVAVNVSPIQFRHKEFVSNVKRILQETGFPPSRLEIELTEGVVVEDADTAEWAMMELKAMGVQLALDDFGTGYSSLIYLRRFAFDKIKIDRSFLESMEGTGESAIIVHSIVHLGRALGLTVTAEGVETEEQHRLLQAVGCHELQGFLFSKPIPARQLSYMLNPTAYVGLQIAS